MLKSSESKAAKIAAVNADFHSQLVNRVLSEEKNEPD